MYIFDFDGTLLDSNGLWLEVDEAFLSRRGLKATAEYEETVSRAIFPTAAAFTREYYGLPESPEEIMAEWEALAARHYRELAPLKPGAREVLARCRASGRGVALFTACRPELCRTALDRLALTDSFDRVVYAETLGMEKHRPECFVRLSELLGVRPEACALFDDSPGNCAAARAAGMVVIGVYDAFYHDRQEELAAVCHRRIGSLAELGELPFSPPPVPSGTAGMERLCRL